MVEMFTVMYIYDLGLQSGVFMAWTCGLKCLWLRCLQSCIFMM